MSFLDDLVYRHLWPSVPEVPSVDVEARVSLLEDEASVASRPPVKVERIGLPFTPEDEAAEALVLDKLAGLCERVSPLEACRLLFVGGAVAGDGSDGDARTRGCSAPQAREDASPVSL